MQLINLIILYENENEITNYIRDIALQQERKKIVLVIIINKYNGSIKDLRDKLNQLHPNIHIFDPGINLGYLNGAIWGYKMYSSIIEEKPQWVIISNTDIKYPTNSFFSQLNNTKYDDEIWCIAPSVYANKYHSYENPAYINRIKKEEINRIIRIHKSPIIAFVYNLLSIAKSKFYRQQKKQSQYIYSGKGCYLILSPDLMDLLTLDKVDLFLYSEESYIAEMIRQHNKHTYFDSDLEVHHYHGSTTNLLGVKKKSGYIVQSLSYIRDRFY